MKVEQLPTDIASMRLLRSGVTALGVAHMVFVFAVPTMIRNTGPTVGCAVTTFGPLAVEASSLVCATVLLLALPFCRLRPYGALLWAAIELCCAFAAHGKPAANPSFVVMFGLAHPALAVLLAASGVKRAAA